MGAACFIPQILTLCRRPEISCLLLCLWIWFLYILLHSLERENKGEALSDRITEYFKGSHVKWQTRVSEALSEKWGPEEGNGLNRSWLLHHVQTCYFSWFKKNQNLIHDVHNKDIKQLFWLPWAWDICQWPMLTCSPPRRVRGKEVTSPAPKMSAVLVLMNCWQRQKIRTFTANCKLRFIEVLSCYSFFV